MRRTGIELQKSLFGAAFDACVTFGLPSHLANR